jgi:hypothetical protein
MKKGAQRRIWPGAAWGAVALMGASCTVDTSNIIFRDDPATGLGGSSSTGGVVNLGGEGPSGSGGGGTGGGGVIGQCTASALRCDGKQVQICSAGAWVAAGGPCQFACDAGICVGECVPGSNQCVSSSVVQVCNVKGDWGRATSCEFACAAGACAGECKPGTKRCSGGSNRSPQTCSDAGQWLSSGDDCSGVCVNGLCEDCTSPDSRCLNTTQVQTCTASSDWGTPVTCENACVGTTCGGSCVPGTKACAVGSQANTHFRTCGTNGEYGAAAACGEQACVGGDCVGVCTPGADRCDGTALQKCSNSGEWTQTSDCSQQGRTCRSYQGNFFCGECQPTAKRCQGNVIQECSATGVWQNGTNCDSTANNYCQSGECRTQSFMSTFCQSNAAEKGCFSAGSKRWTCSGSQFSTATCTGATQCVANAGTCTAL